jgi:hypothetical protein
MGRLSVLLALSENFLCQASIQAVMIAQQASSVRGKLRIVCNAHLVISLQWVPALAQNACPVRFLQMKGALFAQNAARESILRVMGL